LDILLKKPYVIFEKLQFSYWYIFTESDTENFVIVQSVVFINNLIKAQF